MIITNIVNLEKTEKEIKIFGSEDVSLPVPLKFTVFTAHEAYLVTSDNLTIDKALLKIKVGTKEIRFSQIEAIEIPTQLKIASIKYSDYTIGEHKPRREQDSSDAVYISGSLYGFLKVRKGEQYYIDTGIYFKEYTIEDIIHEDDSYMFKTNEGPINLNAIHFISDVK